VLQLFLGVKPLFADIKQTAIGDESHMLQIFWGSDPVVKFTLLLLIAFSIISWAIILYKYRELKQIKQSSAHFYTVFWQASSLSDLQKKRTEGNSPLANIFQAGISPFKSGKNERSIDTIRKNIERSTADEIEKIEKHVPFLATTASSAPFIGLFGTVWGILAAFWQIGQAGSSSLAVVGPYIAEALIATAAGLAAAIPAVIFYNFFTQRIRVLARRIEEFAEDLGRRIEKEYY
jgi:biopolymer transport protein TolQ